jgi:hypothetical protein
MNGNGRRPFTAGDLTFSFFPSGNLTIVNTTSAQADQSDGTGQMLQVNTAVATKNIFWFYHIDEGRISDSLDANYRANKWLGLNAEYRYTDRWLDNNLIRTGTTNSKDLNSLSNHLNTGTLGFQAHPAAVHQLRCDHRKGQLPGDARQPRPLPQHPGASGVPGAEAHSAADHLPPGI